MGRGGALVASGSVTPGIAGIRGGSEREEARPSKPAETSACESILKRVLASFFEKI